MTIAIATFAADQVSEVLLDDISLINLLQSHKPDWVPGFLQNWEFMPLWTRSLKPLDDLFRRMPCCRKCTTATAVENEAPLPDVEMSLRADYSPIAQDEAPASRGNGVQQGLHSSVSKTPLVRDASFAGSVASGYSTDLDEKYFYRV